MSMTFMSGVLVKGKLSLYYNAFCARCSAAFVTHRSASTRLNLNANQDPQPNLLAAYQFSKRHLNHFCHLSWLGPRHWGCCDFVIFSDFYIGAKMSPVWIMATEYNTELTRYGLMGHEWVLWQLTQYCIYEHQTNNLQQLYHHDLY